MRERKRCSVLERETGGKRSFAFEVDCDGKHAGSIETFKSKAGGRVAWVVRRVFVDPSMRRQRLATQLYEAAAREACRRRGRLVSVGRDPGAFSNNFWEKQVRLGRADKMRGKMTDGRVQPVYVLRDCPPPALGVLSRRSRSR